jgi:hypothetical protein
MSVILTRQPGLDEAVPAAPSLLHSVLIVIHAMLAAKAAAAAPDPVATITRPDGAAPASSKTI